MPLTTSDEEDAPWSSLTLTFIMLAAGATPTYAWLEYEPLPAMMPATWVPCPYWSDMLAVLLLNFAWPTTRLPLLLPKSFSVVFTPLSITATPTPWPCVPPWLFQTVLAPIAWG